MTGVHRRRKTVDRRSLRLRVSPRHNPISPADALLLTVAALAVAGFVLTWRADRKLRRLLNAQPDGLTPTAKPMESPDGSPAEEEQTMSVASREEVIAASRRQFSRPRAEVERMIAEYMGWLSPEDSLRNQFAEIAASARELLENLQQEKIELLRDQVRIVLQRVGLSDSEIERLLKDHAWETILRQVMWLPQRKARSPARFLKAAVERDFTAPPSRVIEKEGR